MLLTTLNILFVLVAVAMVALILMQRGAGASAGSGFGGGASATVFGARGSSNFLSKATKWLAITFFAITLFMAWYAHDSARVQPVQDADLGIMSQVPSAPGALEVPVLPAGDGVPTAPAQSEVPSAVPVAPVQDADETPQPTPQNE
jgi:preprotein translocase subunit SecG